MKSRKQGKNTAINWGLYFTALQRALASSRTRLLDRIQRRTTVGRTPLNEWSVRRRDLYLTTHNTHNRQTSMPWVGFEPTISAGEWPKTYALDRAATGTGIIGGILVLFMYIIRLTSNEIFSPSNKIQSVGLFWTSDQPDAETSTWQQTILTTDKHPCPGEIRTHNPSKRAAKPHALGHATAGIQHQLCVRKYKSSIHVVWHQIKNMLPDLQESFEILMHQISARQSFQ